MKLTPGIGLTSRRTTGGAGAPVYLKPLMGASVVTEDSIQLNWTYQNGDETSLEIEKEVTPSNWVNQVTLVGGETDWTDTSLPPGTTQNYRLRVSNGVDTSGFVTVSPATSTFAAPTAFALVLKTDTTVQVSFTDNSLVETDYSMEKDQVEHEEIASNPGTGTVNYTYTGLTAETEYDFRCRAKIDPSTYSTHSNEITVTTNAAPTVQNNVVFVGFVDLQGDASVDLDDLFFDGFITQKFIVE